MTPQTFIPSTPIWQQTFLQKAINPSRQKAKQRPNHCRNQRTKPQAAAPPAEKQNPRVDQHAPENLGFLHVATITSPHGVFGEVKATATTDFPAHRLSATSDLARFLLLPGRRYPRPVKILSSRRASRENVWILRLEGIQTPEEITTKRMKNARLYVRKDDKPPLARGEYVVADVIDLRVALRKDDADFYVTDGRRGRVCADRPVGIVEEVITAEELCKASKGGKRAAGVANDLLQVALFDDALLDLPGVFSGAVPEEATRVLVPFVKEIVPVVDMSVSLMVIDPPAGLFEATVVRRNDKVRPPRGLLMPCKE